MRYPYLHQFLIVVEVRQQHILSICDTGEGDAQSACGLDVRIVWQNPSHLALHYLHHVKGRVHWSQKPLSRFFRNTEEAGSYIS